MPLKPHILGNIGLLYAYNGLITNKIHFFVKPYYIPGLGVFILICKCKLLNRCLEICSNTKFVLPL